MKKLHMLLVHFNCWRTHKFESASFEFKDEQLRQFIDEEDDHR